MTHSGGKPHTNVGDQGQRYEISVFDTDTYSRRILGWSDDYEIAKQRVDVFCKRPSWCDPEIKDRERKP